MSTAVQPEQERVELPPLRGDRPVQAWVVARGLSALGDSVWLVALAWTAVQVAPPAQAGLLLGAGTLPRAGLMLVGGALADRWDARRTVVLANLARVLVLGVGAVGYGALPDRQFEVLLAVALAFGVADALHNPAAATMGRQMVRPDDLRPLLAAFQTVERLGRLGGAPLGGVLVAAVGIRGAMLADAVSFAVVGAVYAGWLRPRFPRALSAGASWRRDLVDGLSYVRRTRDVRVLVAALSGLNLFVGPALAVGVALRVSEGHWGAHTLGLLDAAVGAGAALGAVGAGRSRTRRPARVGFTLLVVQGAATAALGVGGVLAVGVLALVIGVMAGAASTYLSALFQLTVDATYLGRTQSVTTMVDDGLMPVAMIGFGALAGLAGVAGACVAAGAGMALLCGWSGYRLRAS